MTNQTAVIPDAEAEIRWRDWQARGAARDLRTATRMRTAMLLIAAASAVWLFVQLT
jgi:PhoPQ-activated pathogenicity-related protein